MQLYKNHLTNKVNTYAFHKLSLYSNHVFFLILGISDEVFQIKTTYFFILWLFEYMDLVHYMMCIDLCCDSQLELPRCLGGLKDKNEIKIKKVNFLLTNLFEHSFFTLFEEFN